jgi:hypothetical protein
MSMATFVYVISGNHGRQKIGVTDNPKRRIAELQTGSPFSLKFEFVGLTQGTGFDIEGEAHFLLSRHKAPGGDEWFIVPPEVAITAVMAAARQLCHTIKPVDPDNLPEFQGLEIGPPIWHKWVTAILSVPLIGLGGWLLYSFDRGYIGGVATIICTLILIVAFKLLRYALIEAGNMMIWLDRLMHPDDGVRVPLSPDRK